MGATWFSWRTTTTVIISVLQIQALISVKTTAVTGVEGQPFNFRSCFIVKVDKLIREDSGTYWCGVDVGLQPDHISVIQLKVSQAIPQENLTQYKINMPLFLTAAMCVVAMLFVCLFTLGLLLAVRLRRSDPHQNRETTPDYETMRPGVVTEPELCCSCSGPDCDDLSVISSTQPDLCSHFTSKYRESTVTFGIGEYVDVDVPGHACQYQHLDLSQVEEHVYHSLPGNNCPKHGPQINC
uniref:uncharacterized protein LOC109952414 isoform X2 n=1 Tax=Monopterus albus TaxID=43700 RepID=UPI0009B48FEE|nr:uncharacterized protein LOC109952414 isoform X2 [Monopterus albus]